MTVKANHKIWAISELVCGLALIFTYLWLALPQSNKLYHGLVLALFVLIIGWSLFRRKKSLGTYGWIKPRNNFKDWQQLIFATLLIAVLMSGAWAFFFPLNTNFISEKRFWEKLLLYPFWAYFQQFIIIIFVYRLLEEIFINKLWLWILLSTVIFSLIHIPNYPLMIFCFGGGIIWAWFYSRGASLLAIALSHGVLGVIFANVLLMYTMVGPYADPGRWTKDQSPAYGCVCSANGKPLEHKSVDVKISKEEEEFAVSGYVFGVQRPMEEVLLLANDQEFEVKEYGLSTPGMRSTYDYPNALKSGFRVDVPLADLGAGVYALRLKVKLEDRRFFTYPGQKVYLEVTQPP